MNFYNYKQKHGNGILFGSQLYWMNNKSKNNAINHEFRNYGKILSSDLSQHNPYYSHSNLEPNPGTKGLRMVIEPKPNTPKIDAEQLKPSNFGKTPNSLENNVIHKLSIIDAMNNTNSNNIHQ